MYEGWAAVQIAAQPFGSMWWRVEPGFGVGTGRYIDP
jgi:hypothetical protein